MGDGRMGKGIPGKGPEPRKDSFKRIISIKDVVKIQIYYLPSSPPSLVGETGYYKLL